LDVPGENNHGATPAIQHPLAVRIHLEAIETETHQARGRTFSIEGGGHGDHTTFPRRARKSEHQICELVEKSLSPVSRESTKLEICKPLP
tara:strand:- start:347 stop:616 length:270 start_codon:yes stop_codon:yes gene_type:complete